VLENGVPVRRAVELGLTDGSYTEITGGELREGEPVITGIEGQATGGGGGSRGPRGGFRIL
jgi:hypothetical protein